MMTIMLCIFCYLKKNTWGPPMSWLWRRQGVPLALPGKHLTSSPWTAHAQPTQASWDTESLTLPHSVLTLPLATPSGGSSSPKQNVWEIPDTLGHISAAKLLCRGRRGFSHQEVTLPLSSSLPCWARISLPLSFSPPPVKWGNDTYLAAPLCYFVARPTDLRYLKHLLRSLAHSRLSTRVINNNCHSYS